MPSKIWRIMWHMAGCLKKTQCVSKCFARENLNFFGSAFAWRGVTGCGCSFNGSNERLNESMDGMHGADLVVCSLMDFGIWTFLFFIMVISKLLKLSCSLCFYCLLAAACWLFLIPCLSVWISGLIQVTNSILFIAHDKPILDLISLWSTHGS